MKMKDITNIIVIKLIALIVLSLVASTLTFLMLAHYVSNEFFSGPGPILNDLIVKYNIIMLIIFLISIGVFIAIFVVPVNRKLSYIKYITTEVRKLSLKSDSGAVVEIKGNDELAELGLSINSMSRELKRKFEYERELEKTKSELITNISHDLRSPLTSIIGYLELIKEHRFNNEVEFNNYVEIIDNKSQSLKNLIDELFEYAKLSSSGLVLDYQTIELSGLLEQIFGEYIPIFEGNGLEIIKDFSVEVEVDIDVEKIVRVMTNLLENARKYSVKPSKIRAALSKTPDNVRISVMNSVQKLPTQCPEKLFERFSKGNSARTEDNSSGLGLAIARKIIEVHGGNIRAIYSSNTIEFVLEIPIKAFLVVSDK